MYDTLPSIAPSASGKRLKHSVLEARSLRWRHGERWIVKDVSLVARSGEIVGLLGPNGAGKTVTLTMLAGLLRPTSGHIVIDGVDITEMPMYQRARHGLGYLPQEHSIFTKMNTLENIAAILEARGAGRRVVRRRGGTPGTPAPLRRALGHEPTLQGDQRTSARQAVSLTLRGLIPIM